MDPNFPFFFFFSLPPRPTLSCLILLIVQVAFLYENGDHLPVLLESRDLDRYDDKIYNYSSIMTGIEYRIENNILFYDRHLPGTN